MDPGRSFVGWRLPLLLGLILVLGCTLASCGLFSERSGAKRAGSDGPAPTLAQIGAVLASHAEAVLSHSAAAFLADIDTAGAASDFRARQRDEIASLAQVPLRSWRYAVSSQVTDPAAIAAGTKRLGTPVLIVHLTLSYALAYVDPHPSSHDLWWSFVRRHGRVYVAGDDDIAAVGGVSWAGPWDFGPLTVVRGKASLVLGHPSAAAQLPRLAAEVDAAVPVVSGVWGTGWVRQVAVLLPGSAAEFSALVGQSSATTDVSAEAVADPPDPGDGGVYGQRLVLAPSALAALTPAGLRIVVQHELTHIASAAATGQSSPRWLVEGFAEYVGNLGNAQPVTVAARELRQAVAGGKFPDSLPGDAQFAAGSPRLPEVYEQSWLACRLIAARVGQAGLVRFYRLVGGSSDGPGPAVGSAAAQVLHESVAAFAAQWRTYLAEQFR